MKFRIFGAYIIYTTCFVVLNYICSSSNDGNYNVFVSGKSVNYHKKRKYYENVLNLFKKNRPKDNPYNIKNPQKKRYPTIVKKIRFPLRGLHRKKY